LGESSPKGEHRALPRHPITRDQKLPVSKNILDNLPADRQCCKDYLHATLKFQTGKKSVFVYDIS